MKQIEKEVVTTKIVYVAEDGKEFNNSESCLRHEEQLEESKRIATLLSGSKMVELSEETFTFSSNDEELVILAKFESEQDVICSAFTLEKIEYIDSASTVVNAVKAEMKHKNVSYPFNAILSINYDVWVTIGYEKTMLESANKISEIITNF